MVKAYVINGSGIGCHKEVAHAYEKAGAKVEIILYNELLKVGKKLFDSQILNLPGGFFHGDNLGPGMCAANELEHARPEDEKRIKDLLLEYAEKGNVIYGQCNGFQLLVKTGLLPGINNSEQAVTLTENDCGIYRVDFVPHRVAMSHFAFEGIDNLYLWCRHAEGKLQFHSELGSISEEKAKENKNIVNKDHVLLRYADPVTWEQTQEFPHNLNGSVDGIAGLVSSNGNIFGNMGHPEVSTYWSRHPEWFTKKDEQRRKGVKAEDLDLKGIGLKIFQNIVDHVR